MIVDDSIQNCDPFNFMHEAVGWRVGMCGVDGLRGRGVAVVARRWANMLIGYDEGCINEVMRVV